jgi:hypothetical protein
MLGNLTQVRHSLAQQLESVIKIHLEEHPGRPIRFTTLLNGVLVG